MSLEHPSAIPFPAAAAAEPADAAGSAAWEKGSALESFRRREVSLALLNLAVLAILFLLHVAFISLLGPPRPVVVWVLVTLFAFQVFTLTWVQGLREMPSARVDRMHGMLSIAVLLAGGFLASILGEGEDHHYFVMMVPPVISAAFRYPPAGVLVVAAAAGTLTFYDVWRWYALHPPGRTSEFFEAATVLLIYFVVGGVVWALAEGQRRDARRLRESLDALRRTRDRLVSEERHAAVGRLSSAIAHEIRNPVTMISSSLAAARREGLDEATRRQMFDVAHEEMERLERLTTDFLDYARSRPPDLREVELDAAVGYVVELARARAGEGAVTIADESGPGLRASLDARQLHRALLNLVSNALEHTPEGGRVEVGAGRADDGGFVMWVENTGTPIGAEVLPHVFEPFYSTRPGGTGLGLAIARRVARAHGGELALALNARGRVRFEIRLPAGSAVGGRV